MSSGDATKSLTELLKELSLDQAPDDCSDRGFSHWLWFRGQSHSQWTLTPGALREDFLRAAMKRLPNMQLAPTRDVQGHALEYSILAQLKDAAAHVIPA